MMKYLVFLALVAGLPTSIISIDANCDYYQNVVPGTTYYVFNTEYPNYYTGARSCQWYAQTTSPNRLRINCQTFSLPASANCAGDRFAVSPSGNLNLADARNFCGTGTFNISSDSNSMNMVFTAYAGTTGGRFLCALEAISPAPTTCSCGYKKMSKIVGGVTPGVNEYTMMAGVVNLQSRLVMCGATIISKQYVLSAAHCFVRISANQIAVLVGDHDLSTGSETSATALILATRISVHPAFDSNTQANDVAIITTRDPIQFSMNVGPACLPFRYASTTFAGSKVDALGWGTVGFAEATSDILQKVTLDVTQLRTCQEKLPAVTNNQICTYTPQKDTCQFDSGGPILWQNPNTRRLFSVGIISYGVSCASNSPSVNTRTGAYMDWIVSVTPGADYCVAE